MSDSYHFLLCSAKEVKDINFLQSQKTYKSHE